MLYDDIPYILTDVSGGEKHMRANNARITPLYLSDLILPTYLSNGTESDLFHERIYPSLLFGAGEDPKLLKPAKLQ